jgi:hypothetical protein
MCAPQAGGTVTFSDSLSGFVFEFMFAAELNKYKTSHKRGNEEQGKRE